MEDHNCSGSLKRKGKSKSKLAEMAEANEAGKDVMFGSKEEPEK